MKTRFQEGRETKLLDSVPVGPPFADPHILHILNKGWIAFPSLSYHLKE